MKKTDLDIDSLITGIRNASIKPKSKRDYVPTKLKLGTIGVDCLIKNT